MATRLSVEKTSWTAEELHNTEMPPVKWLIEQISPQGFSWLAGKPKIGKSFLELQKCLTIVNPDGELFGYKTMTSGRVLYISLEDNGRRLKRRLDNMLIAMGLESPSWLRNLEIETSWRRLDQGGVDDLLKRLDKRKYILSVMDTFKRALPIKDNDSGVVSRLLSPFHEMTKSGEFSFEFVDHHRKMGDYSGDAIEDISGSIGKGGASDTVWALYRERGQQKANLVIASRDTEVEGFELLFDKEKTLWFKREQDYVKPNTIQAKIMERIRGTEEENYVTDLAIALGQSKALISREMKELENKGIISRGNKQGKRVPFVLANGRKKGI